MDPYLSLATDAAHEAGASLRAHFGTPQRIEAIHRRDVKLAIDAEVEALIVERVRRAFPDHAILGEEGGVGGGMGDVEWIIDPLDGTANYLYGIPHFCVSIAARDRRLDEAIVGVVFDPMQDETWSVVRGASPTLNGAPIRCSARSEMHEAIVTVGFSKHTDAYDDAFARYHRIARAAHKTRSMGSAALALAYIACGRLDVYVEDEIQIWDIAAGKMLVEAAGGRVTTAPYPSRPHTLAVRAWNGSVPIERYL